MILDIEKMSTDSTPDKDFVQFLMSDDPAAVLALTDKSYRKKDESAIHNNGDLATLGDSVLSLGLCTILYDPTRKCEISENKKFYESDEVLAKVIAKHYEILNLLRYDNTDTHKWNRYAWVPNADRKDPSKKYLATAMEALLGAYFLHCNQDMGRVLPVIRYWKRLISEDILNKVTH